MKKCSQFLVLFAVTARFPFLCIYHETCYISYFSKPAPVLPHLMLFLIKSKVSTRNPKLNYSQMLTANGI